MQAIQTKYFGPSNVRGSRIKASADAGSVTVSYNHAMDSAGNHRAAAEALCAKLGWTGQMIGGALPGSGYAFVFVEA